MINLRLFFILFSFMAISPSNGQDFSSHRWEDRLVIIRTSNSENSLFKKQLEELKNDSEGLKERKIVLYQAVAENYKRGTEEENTWKKIDKENELLNQPSAEFEILLIGLDGRIKIRKKELLTLEELYGTIDQMPMRMSEIRRKKKDN